MSVASKYQYQMVNKRPRRKEITPCQRAEILARKNIALVMYFHDEELNQLCEGP